MRVEVWIQDQKVFTSETAGVKVDFSAGLLRVFDGNERTIFAYYPRPGQYAHVRNTDNLKVVKFND